MDFLIDDDVTVMIGPLCSLAPGFGGASGMQRSFKPFDRLEG
tara:strand:- start:191 stop:316 length:126 start_codon:yes stop_codon:yes gene_type:complete